MIFPVLTPCEILVERMMTRRTTLLALALLLVGCASKPPEKQYAMHGDITALDPAAKTATINAGKIGDWMDAMKMEFPIKPDAEFSKLHVGDRIQATVVVNDLKYYVTDIKVVSK
jgi:Cu/Ag efflux protein CusF